MYFCNFVIISQLEKDGELHWNKLDSHSAKDDVCQVWLKLAQWFWRERFLKFVNTFSLFRYYLSLKKGVALHLYKLLFLNYLPLKKGHKDDLCQVWLKLVQWLWRRRWKCEKFRTTTTTTTDNGQIVLEKLVWAFSSDELKKWKVYDNDYYKDNGQIVIRESYFGFGSGELNCCSGDKLHHPSKNISCNRFSNNNAVPISILWFWH